MENQKNISEELTSISEAVAAIERKNTYFVPEDYFTLLPESILKLVQDDPQLSLPATNVYTVPAGFFENFASGVLNRIAQEESAQTEIETLSPLLASLKNKETFRAPEGFFEAPVFDVPVENTEAKVVTMQPRRSNWSRYAVAASVAVILGITGFFTFSSTKTTGETASVPTSSLEQNMSSVTDDELEEYIFQTTDYPMLSTEGEPEVEASLSNINEEDIKDYLKENSIPSASTMKGI
jgi:hypothetical protein